jgi:hypothetical protein
VHDIQSDNAFFAQNMRIPCRHPCRTESLREGSYHKR